MKRCDRLLRMAAWLAPHEVRRDWLREWQAEIAYAQRRHTSTVLTVRTLGAFVHAVWLRWERWRLEMLLQDIKYAVRTLTRQPGFAAISILTLAIGIGANAAIFGAVRAVLLRPLSFPQPEQLVQISSTTRAHPQIRGGSASAPDFLDWRAGAASFSEMAALSAGAIPWSGDGTAEQVPYAMVTGGFFNVMGTPAVLGRALGYEDDAVGGPDVVVISYQLWSRRFGSDRNVLGRAMTLDGTPRRVVGVMPAGFSYPLGSELWVPLRFTPDMIATQRGAHYLEVVARLKEGVTVETAQSEMSGLVSRLAEEYPRTNANKAVAVFELREALVGNVKPALMMILAAVGFVLLIVCVNISSLTLTRATGRTRELAVRAALGAGRSRLINGLFTESVVVALAGGAAGLLIAVWATGIIARLDSGIGIPLLDQTRVDGEVVAFTFGMAAIAAILFGTLPAWHASSRLDIAQRIREGAGNLTAGRDRQRLKALLIVAETALAVTLLVGAGLLMRTFLQIAAVDLGFNATRVQTFSISLPEAKYPTPVSRATFVETLLTRLAQNPEVESASAIMGLPLTRFSYGFTTSEVDGRRLTDEEQDQRVLQVRIVTPEYFRTMGVRITRGSAFNDAHRLGSRPVAIVNEDAARLLWAGADPLGRSVAIGTRLGQGGERAGGEVIGVAANVRDFGPTQPTRPTIYFAHGQFPDDFLTVTLKARNAASALVEPSRAVLATLDPDLPMFRVRSMEQFVSNAVAQPRLYVILLSVFAAAAVLLAGLGIYGVLAHGVTQRTREIGIRLALGAERREVVALVTRHAVLLALAGLMVGLVLALGTSRLMEGLLFGVKPVDALTYSGVAILLFFIALVAAYVPARRAARIDPIKALRYE